MPFPISLERDLETGLDRYVILASEGFGSDDARELCDWLSAAAQNPAAAFQIDLGALDPRAPAVRIVSARTAWLRSARRVDLVTPRVTVSAA